VVNVPLLVSMLSLEVVSRGARRCRGRAREYLREESAWNGIGIERKIKFKL